MPLPAVLQLNRKMRLLGMPNNRCQSILAYSKLVREPTESLVNIGKTLRHNFCCGIVIVGTPVRWRHNKLCGSVWQPCHGSTQKPTGNFQSMELAEMIQPMHANACDNALVAAKSIVGANSVQAPMFSTALHSFFYGVSVTRDAGSTSGK